MKRTLVMPRFYFFHIQHSAIAQNVEALVSVWASRLKKFKSITKS